MALGVNFGSLCVVMAQSTFISKQITSLSSFFLPSFETQVSFHFSLNICTEVFFKTKPNISDEDLSLRRCANSWMQAWISSPSYNSATFVSTRQESAHKNAGGVGRDTCEGASSSPLFAWSHITWRTQLRVCIVARNWKPLTGRAPHLRELSAVLKDRKGQGQQQASLFQPNIPSYFVPTTFTY